jgi:hypothetical protein
MNSEAMQYGMSASTTVSLLSSTTVATGTLDTINNYAPLIGICLSIISILLGLFFFISNNVRETRLSKLYNENLLKERRAESQTINDEDQKL